MVGGRACSGTWHWRRGGGVGGPTPRRSPSGEGLGPPSPRPSAIGRHPVAGKPPRPAPPPPPRGPAGPAGGGGLFHLRTRSCSAPNPPPPGPCGSCGCTQPVKPPLPPPPPRKVKVEAPGGRLCYTGDVFQRLCLTRNCVSVNKSCTLGVPPDSLAACAAECRPATPPPPPQTVNQQEI